MVSVLEPQEKQPPGAAFKKTQATRSQRFQRWSSTSIQFLRYCLVGGLNTIIDILMLNILLWRLPTHNVQILVVYNSLAYCSGSISSFFLNKYWTFRRMQRPTAGEIMRFVGSALLELLYNNGLIWLAGRVLQPFITNITLWGNAAKLVAVVSGAVLSYSLMRFWTFAGRFSDQEEKPEIGQQPVTDSDRAATLEEET